MEWVPFFSLQSLPTERASCLIPAILIFSIALKVYGEDPYTHESLLHHYKRVTPNLSTLCFPGLWCRWSRDSRESVPECLVLATDDSRIPTTFWLEE